MDCAEVLPPSHFTWRLATRTLELGRRTRLMGIVNVTPDSFSDGGTHPAPQAAVEHALRLLDDGADMLDIGGESTRPGSPAATQDALAQEEEQRRVLPVVEGILRLRPAAILSVDTYRAATAERAVQAGAEIVNDVSGLLWDGAMTSAVAHMHCGLVLMHTRGRPSEWQDQDPYPDATLLPTLLHDLEHAVTAAEQAGIAKDRIVLDPGFGFGKRGEQNWSVLQHFGQLAQLGRPLLAGLSRKGFLAPELRPGERDAATHAAGARAVAQGAHILRVHDVRGAARMLREVGRW